MIDDIDIDDLKRVRRIAYYFRYPLHRKDFRELRAADELRGHYAAKPLYGKLTPEGKVDRSGGYNGDVAALFVPLDARTADDVSVVLSHNDPASMTTKAGRRNWPAIRASAERSLRAKLGLNR